MEAKVMVVVGLEGRMREDDKRKIDDELKGGRGGGG